ncbi:MAG: NAD-dependent epimerase/dehydratase family protein [Planctomycetota bacterium]|nr:MAG: NAD-dependent epimerase/dehydratase family protein [Planctomycetota bacterium]
MIVGVTGANGFIGGALIRYLHNAGVVVRALPRNTVSGLPSGVECRGLALPSMQLEAGADIGALSGCDTLIHAGARAHVLSEDAADSLAAFRSANRDGSIALFQAAARAGVRRCIFISTIGVCGTIASHPLAPRAKPAPEEPYQVAKWEAEVAVREIAHASGMELLILRLPLVHGPGAPGNFAVLCRAIARGRVLPLGGITSNRRSFVGVRNVCSAIHTIVSREWSKSKDVYHLCDQGVMSTRQLVEILALGIGRRARLLTVPRSFAMAAGSLCGKGKALRRLYGDLEVDGSQFYTDFSWQPKVSLEGGLFVMGRAFRDRS